MFDRKDQGRWQLELIKDAMARGGSVILINYPDAQPLTGAVGMAPSVVNESAQAEIAAVRKFRSAWAT